MCISRVVPSARSQRHVCSGSGAAPPPPGSSGSARRRCFVLAAAAAAASTRCSWGSRSSGSSSAFTASAGTAAAASARQQQQPLLHHDRRTHRWLALSPPRAFALEPLGQDGDGGSPASSQPALHFDGAAAVTVGSAPGADVAVPAAAPRHAELVQKGGRQVFVKALVGESVFDATGTFVDGAEARPNVAYVLADGAVVSFGAPDESGGSGGSGSRSFRVRFDEPSGANPLVEMLIAGAAAGASPEVKKALDAGR